MSIVLCSAAASWPKQVSPGMATAISISLSTTKTITSCAAAPGAVTANIVAGGRGGPGRSASRSRIWALSRICTALRRIDGPPRARSHGSERLDKSLDRLGDGAPQDCLVGKQLELGTLGRRREVPGGSRPRVRAAAQATLRRRLRERADA